MGQQRMRDELDEHVKIAQNSIETALQKLHDDTGLVPVAVHFEVVDVRTFQQYGKGQFILVSNVHVQANT